MSNLYDDIRKKISKLEEIEAKIEELAILLGSKERGNLHNSFLMCEKAICQHLEYKKKAEELNSSLGNIIRSYRMRQSPESKVPAEMRFAPPHWITEASTETVTVWKDSKRVDKVYRVGEVSAVTAQRLRHSLQGQLESLFELLESSDWGEDVKRDYKESVIKSYRTDSFQQFSEGIAESLWYLTSGMEEEEIEQDTGNPASRYEEEFDCCLDQATMYSSKVREELVSWAKESDVTIDEYNLRGWASAYPNRLFSHLMKIYLEAEDPINGWVLDALQSVGVKNRSSHNWPEFVDLGTITKMVRCYQRMLEDSPVAITQDTILNALTEICRISAVPVTVS